MKKTLLAAATLSALMASGMANAAFTDADGSGGWTGNLEFNGAITNTNPAWKYQIPEATIAGAKNWNVKRSDGTVDGSNTNFSFAKNFTVLEGVMKAPAPKGVSGLQPVVTFGEAGNTVVWDTTNTSMATPKALTVTAKNGQTTVGSLEMQLVGQALSTWNVIHNNTKSSLWEGFYGNVPDALRLLKAQPYFTETYKLQQGGDPIERGTLYASTSPMWNGANKDMTAALVADASKFKLSFPTASIPDVWTATLPISITVK